MESVNRLMAGEKLLLTPMLISKISAKTTENLNKPIDAIGKSRATMRKHSRGLVPSMVSRITRPIIHGRIAISCRGSVNKSPKSASRHNALFKAWVTYLMGEKI